MPRPGTVVNLSPAHTHSRLFAVQDDLLVSMSSIAPSFDLRQARRLPPWRAVMLARIAYAANLLPRADLDDLVREASLIGGNGTLKNRTDHTAKLGVVKCPKGNNYAEHTGPCSTICDYPEEN